MNFVVGTKVNLNIYLNSHRLAVLLRRVELPLFHFVGSFFVQAEAARFSDPNISRQARRVDNQIESDGAIVTDLACFGGKRGLRRGKNSGCTNSAPNSINACRRSG